MSRDFEPSWSSDLLVILSTAHSHPTFCCLRLARLCRLIAPDLVRLSKHWMPPRESDKGTETEAVWETSPFCLTRKILKFKQITVRIIPIASTLPMLCVLCSLQFVPGHRIGSIGMWECTNMPKDERTVWQIWRTQMLVTTPVSSKFSE